jgi:glycosyltransferase involved in cell wall biosynthesis
VLRILLLVPELDYGGAARQVSLIAAHLPRDRFEVFVGVLGVGTPWVENLRRLGCCVETLGWQRPFDIAPFLRLRRLLAGFRPELIHAWGPSTLRGLALVGGPGRARLFLSDLLTANQSPGWLDRWLGRNAMVVARGQVEAERCRLQGILSERIAVLLPAVEDDPGNTEVVALPGLPDSARVLLTLGPFHAHRGHREAVWALDILHYLYDDLHLVLLGSGPERDRVIEFSHFIGASSHVHFPGPAADVRPWLRRAELVWVPSRTGGGVNTALEAMAAGKPVVAARLPALAEIVADGETGLLFDPGDKADMSRQTRMLLDDSARRNSFGAAGLQRVRERFTVQQLVESCVRLYTRSVP